MTSVVCPGLITGTFNALVLYSLLCNIRGAEEGEGRSNSSIPCDKKGLTFIVKLYDTCTPSFILC